MARKPPSKDERDSNLDALKEAVDEWADKEKTRLENEVFFMRAVLDGRFRQRPLLNKHSMK